MKHHIFGVCALALSVLALQACGEPIDDEAAGIEQVTKASSVSVVPHFNLTGVDELPDKLHIESLGFMVSEIRLEPLSGRAGEFAYSLIRPFEVDFDVDSGQFVATGETIQLPRDGRYLVSLRIEPIEQRGEFGVELLPSFNVSGYVSETQPEFESARDGENFIGPIPVPVVDDDGEGSEGGEAKPGSGGEDYAGVGLLANDQWTSFTYRSARSVFLPLNEVSIEEGENTLEFEFDLSSWAFDVVDPITRAVTNASNPSPNANGGVDVSTQMESGGYGAESFVTGGRASAMAR